MMGSKDLSASRTFARSSGVLDEALALSLQLFEPICAANAQLRHKQVAHKHSLVTADVPSPLILPVSFKALAAITLADFADAHNASKPLDDIPV